MPVVEPSQQVERDPEPSERQGLGLLRARPAAMAEEQFAKLRMVVELVDEIWGEA